MTKEVIEEGSLLRVTRDLFARRTESIPYIAVKAGVPFYWLMKFADGTTKDPSVNRVQRLYEYLSGHKLLED